MAGSSPLARGLLGCGAAGRGRARIIPARAGFTRPASPQPRRDWDHPRSRGVYRHWRAASTRRTRIIPARAGFTGMAPTRLFPDRDHPRSRGVYGDLVDRLRAAGGSSPLARGLLDRRWHDEALRRIIPARAGFTRQPKMRRRTHSDHPRSRGVYDDDFKTAGDLLGSSPLARGLPARSPRARGAIGIIPARAGFTPKRGTENEQDQDHPRSRGVYATASASLSGAVGSSPLARGLHDARGLRLHLRGIIPARAGFTVGG